MVDTDYASAAFVATVEAIVVLASFLHAVDSTVVVVTSASADHMDFAKAFTVGNKLTPVPSSNVQAVSRTASVIEMMDLWL